VYQMQWTTRLLRTNLMLHLDLVGNVRQPTCIRDAAVSCIAYTSHIAEMARSSVLAISHHNG